MATAEMVETVETKDAKKSSTGRVTVDMARVDRLKEQYLSTPQAIDHERTVIMADVYEGTAGYQQIIRACQVLRRSCSGGRRSTSTRTSSWAPWRVPSTRSTPIRNGTWSG